MKTRKIGLKEFFKLFLLLFIMTSLCLPVRVLAADNGRISNFLTKAKSVYKNARSGASTYKTKIKSELQNKINGSQKTVNTKLNNIKGGLSNVKSKLPSIKGGLSNVSIKSKISNVGIKNSFKINNANTVNTKKNNIDINGTIPFFLKGTCISTVKPSQLIVPQGGKKVEKMLNNLSSESYYVDKNGYVRNIAGAPEDLNKSREYSIIIDNLINGNKPTKTYAFNSKFYGNQIELKNSNTVLVGKNSFTGHTSDTVLAHELIHSFRANQGITISPFDKNERAHEEACAIKVENMILHKNGLPMRFDGSSLDDVNKDGKPDGDNSYGKYIYDEIGQNWPGNYLNSTSKL